MMPSVNELVEQPVRRAELTPECVHCGLCLQACPTYLQLGNEADSPRGRIYLIRAQQAGEARVSGSFIKHISACLDCRACESACPSGVPYGEMVEKAREVIEHIAPQSLVKKILRFWFFKLLLPSRSWLRFSYFALRFYQLSGLRKVLKTSGILRLLPGHFDQMECLLPDLRERTHHVRPGKTFPAMGAAKHRVGLLTGCIMNELFGDINQATIRVLQRNGCDVVVPKEQACCGALHCHAGMIETARKLAIKNICGFEKTEVDVVISNASGCGAKLKEYPSLFPLQSEMRQRATEFASRVKDISSFLDELPEFVTPGKVAGRVAYDDPCHLLHAMKVSQAPRKVLRLIPELQLVELRAPDQCCGSAGIYNLTHFELSMKILERKIEDIKQARVDIVATGNPGCILQISFGLKRAGVLGVKVVHPIELLDQAYSISNQS